MTLLRSIAPAAILLGWFAIQAPLRGTIVIEGNQVHASSTILFQESFEGTGYQNTWTEIIGSGASAVDEDDATYVTAGSQCLKVARGTSSTYTYCAVFTASAVVRCTFSFVTNTVGSNNQFFTISDTAGGTDRGFVRVTTTGAMQIYGNTAGSVSATTTDTVSVNTVYYVQAIWNRSTGTYSVEFNTSGTFNGTGSDFKDNTNGETTQTIASVRVGAAVNSYTSYFDNIVVQNQ